MNLIWFGIFGFLSYKIYGEAGLFTSIAFILLILMVGYVAKLLLKLNRIVDILKSEEDNLHNFINTVNSINKKH